MLNEDIVHPKRILIMTALFIFRQMTEGELAKVTGIEWGILELSNDELIFHGKDVKENREFQLRIPLKNITDIHYGFDEVFRGREERAWPWNKPLRVKYQSEDGERTVYLFAHFHHEKGIVRTSDNKELYERLKKLTK